MPADAYVGMFIDGDGPEGIMRALPASQTEYFRYLPMYYPYVVKPAPDTFVVQFGGGISAMVALRSGSRSVTVAESNPAVLAAFRDPSLRDFSGDILHNPKVQVVPTEGRLYLANTSRRYDLVDLSLADSVGLSNPGGFAIVEKYPYTREALIGYIGALRDGGIFSATLWNKEEPPKSILRFYATVADAARAVDGNIANSFFVASTYLSTATVLYKRGGFTADEVVKLREHTRAMSFDEIYSPGFGFDAAGADLGFGRLPRIDFRSGCPTTRPEAETRLLLPTRRRAPCRPLRRETTRTPYRQRWWLVLPGRPWSVAAGMSLPTVMCSMFTP